MKTIICQLIVCAAIAQQTVAAETIFPVDEPSSKWVTFKAEGFNDPVTGVIYHPDSPLTDGMPLGAIDTGCLDLEKSGLWGYCTLFNTITPRGGPVNLPFLGINIDGVTWVLCDPTRTKPYDAFPYIMSKPYYKPSEVGPTNLDLAGCRTVKKIDYWGHYPVADVEFETGAPVGVGLRAWTPFLPGDISSSTIPGIVLEVHLRNLENAPHKGTLAFSFPGPSSREMGGPATRVEVHRGLEGVLVQAPYAAYAIGAVTSRRNVRTGGELGADGAAWSRIADELPAANPDGAGESVAVKFDLKPGGSAVVKLILTWCAPQWKGGGRPTSTDGHTFTHMYARAYPNPAATAKMLARNSDALLARILAWQKVIYSDPTLPGWLQDSLINNFHLITECGLWAQAQPPVPAWARPEDGLFGMNECPRDCPQTECIPCSFYGNLPLVYFFPQLALSTLRGDKGYQYTNGGAPWFWGGGTEVTAPAGFCPSEFCMANFSEYQDSLTGISYTAMVDRYRMCWGDKNFDREFYDSIKRNTIHMVHLCTAPSRSVGERIISMPDGKSTEWFEAVEPGWYGLVPHVGALHIAQLRIARRMAEAMNDTEFAGQCAEWIEAAQDALEKNTWEGDYYLTCWDPGIGKRNDFVFGYQLDGQWVADSHGVPGVFRPDRVKTTLKTIRRCNAKVSTIAASNYANPDGTPADIKGYGPYNYFPAEAIMLACTYLYEGDKDFGLDLARRTWENLVCRWGYTWDMPNAFDGGSNSGRMSYGHDYYQSMMLWSLPAAILGQDLGSITKPGGLVDRILKASKPAH